MSEKLLRNIFIAGTLLFMVVLVGMTVDSLQQVIKTRTPQLTDAVVAGKQVWQNKNCNDCHTVLGIGGYFAPELTKVVDRRGAQWLTAWLTNPQLMIPGTTMPNQRLSQSNVTNLVTFFTWVNQVNTNNWPPQPLALAGGAGQGAPTAAPGAAQAGTPSANVQDVAALVQKGGCSGCHTIPGIQGAVGTVGPNWCVPAQNLRAGKIDQAYIRRAIVDPNADIAQGYSPNIMPQNYGTLFAGQEIDTLVAYIAGLNCK